MASAYPGGLDAFNNPTSSDNLNTTGVLHDVQHSDANDAIEAIETELGVNPSGAFATVAAAIAGGGSLLGWVNYFPSDTEITVTSSTSSDVDATNISVTFVAPSSGVVTVLASIPYAINPPAGLILSLRESGADLTGTMGRVAYAASGVPAVQGTATREWIITGLTPGSTHTYKLGCAKIAGGGTTYLEYGPGYGPVTMTIRGGSFSTLDARLTGLRGVLTEYSGTLASTTSAAFVDVDATNITASIPAAVGDRLRCTLRWAQYHSTSNTDVYVTFSVGGTAMGGANGVFDFANHAVTTVQSLITQWTTPALASGQISGGNCLVKPQWRTAAGTTYLPSATIPCQLEIENLGP